MLTVAVLADTHDLVRDELRAALAGADRVLHAGDLCSPAVLDALATIAPVTAVRGNNDRGSWADALPEATLIELEQVRVWLCHDRADLIRLPPPPATDLVVVGHSHRPVLEPADAASGRPAMLNPGSPGRRRFSLPISCAKLHVDGRRWQAGIITLDPAPKTPRSRAGGRRR